MAGALSVCMIVRDEESNLAGAIDSVRAVARELVVVDTGSRDGTVALARSLGARVLDFPWVDDFSAARNAALAEARGDWILSLDADQRLDPASLPALDQAMQRSAMAQIVHVDMLGQDGAAGPVGSYPALRLFRRHAAVRYRGRVHEDVAASLIELGSGDWPDSGLRLRDIGYVEAAARRAKRDRNLRLLHMSLQEDPDSLFLAYKLATTLPPARARERSAMLARAAEAMRRLPPQRLATLPFCHRLLAAALDDLAARGRLAEAAALGAVLAPALGAGSDFAAGRACARAGAAEAASACLERFIASDPRAEPAVLLPDPAADRGEACRWLGWLACAGGQADEARTWFERARRCAAPHQALAVECELVRVDLRAGRAAAAAEGFARLHLETTGAPGPARAELMLLAAELTVAGAGDPAGAVTLLQAARAPGDDRAEALLARLTLDGIDAGDPRELLERLPGRRYDTLAARAALAQRLGQPLDFTLPPATHQWARTHGWAIA